MIKLELTPADMQNLMVALRLAIKHPESSDDDMLVFTILRQNMLGQANKPEPVAEPATNGTTPIAPVRTKRGDRRAKPIPPTATLE